MFYEKVHRQREEEKKRTRHRQSISVFIQCELIIIENDRVERNPR
jgi:hypothetical protein